MIISQASAVRPTGEHSASYNMTFKQAINVWLLHWKGHKHGEIAAKLGTNALRVDAILNERQFVGSREKAHEVYLPRR